MSISFRAASLFPFYCFHFEKWFYVFYLTEVPENPTPKVAFHARLMNTSSNHIPTARGKIIKFELTPVNTVSAYNPADGFFIAPEQGTYVFTWTMNTCGYTWVNTEIMVNGHSRGQTIADSEEANDHASSTGIIVTSLLQGDNVYIIFKDTSYLKGDICLDEGQSTFSGWKLD